MNLKPIIITAVCTGIRKGEVVNIKWVDIDFRNGIIYIGDTKNGKPREMPMNDLLTETLKSIKRNDASPYVFCDDEGKPYYDFRKSFATALKKAGIEDFRFHVLRHTFASSLVMKGADLVTVKELLGHKTRVVKIMDSLTRMDTNTVTKHNLTRVPVPKRVGKT